MTNDAQHDGLAAVSTHGLSRRRVLALGGTLAGAVALGGLPGTAEATPAPSGHAGGGAPVNLIIDTDIFSDCDDTGALAIANAAHDNGKVNLLGVMVDTPSKWGAPAVDAINTYYGHGNIPIGTLKPNDDSTFTKNYAQYLAQHFPNSIKSGTRAPDAVDLYRKILAHQPDHSVTIAAIGLETNLANLLNSRPDHHSRLSGMDLVAQKVKLLSVMGGQYPSGREFNFFSDAASTQRVVNDWPTRAVFDGFEVGVSVYTGSRLFTQTPSDNPVRKAYEIYVGYGNNRNSWDPSNVFYSIYGADQLFTLGGDVGSNHVNPDGSNAYIASPDKDQNYLVKATADSTIARALSDLMVQPPRQGPNAP